MNKKSKKCPVCLQPISRTKQELLDLFNIDQKLSNQLTEKQVKKSYHEKAKQTHPDKGGSEQEFFELTQAKEELLKMIEPTDNLNINPIGNAINRQAKENYNSSTQKQTRQQFIQTLKTISNLRKENARNPLAACPLCKRTRRK